ncbi:hypothetical protein EAI_12831 [Harpegnathos saltator]|uniref:Uncharacterized protein n=1 Tax=Harpegnathos saltator TaxID=610380 RepID=E2BTG0_HARSA|nr:hypothetical protein EAI_12831 [Harpegnathos saltator]
MTLNWYLQLRKVAKIRRFFESIARRSNASIIDTVRRVGHSLDDANLVVAIVRRGKYTSLLSLDELFEESSNRVRFNRVYSDLRASKSLTTSITSNSYDTRSTNDYDSISNDLSVAEKSMKILDITAEDVMDARARIQERSYWEEQHVIAKHSNPVGKMITYFPLEEDEKETNDAFRNRETVVDNKEDNKEDINKEETADSTLEKENTIRYPLMEKEKEEEESNSEIILQDRKKDVLTEKEWEEVVNFLLLQNEDIRNDKISDHVKSTKSRDFHPAPKEKKEGEQETARSVQCSSSGYKRTTNGEPCSSFVKDTEARFPSVSASKKYKWVSETDQKRHPYRVETKPASTIINANRKEHRRSSEITSLLTCHCASGTNINAQKNKRKYSQSTDTKDKNVNRDIVEEKLKCFTSNVVAQKDKPNGNRFALKHLERRLKKRAQTCEECSEKQPASWNSMSLAQTARPSGYEKRFVATNNKTSARQENCKSVQTEASNELKDSLSRRYRLKHVQQTQHTQLSDLHLANGFDFKRRNTKLRKHEVIEAQTLEAYDFILLEEEKLIKTRNRHNLPSSRKLLHEEREAIELRALKAYNEQTLLEDKKKLEARKQHDSSLNYKRSLKVPEIPKMKDPEETHDDVASVENRDRIEIITGSDLSTNCQQSIEKPRTLVAHRKLISSDDNLTAGKEYNLLSHATSSTCEEDLRVPMRPLNHLLQADKIVDHLSKAETMSHLSETRDNLNSDFDLNNHNARHAGVSLNLREITRNIEWTSHPRGIVLINKSLQGAFPFSENGRSRESQQRDIVDNDTASALHNAFFFKLEIKTRIFRRAQTRLEESSFNFETSRRGDFSAEFVCRVNNEMNVQDRDSLFDLNFEWVTEGRSNQSRPLFLSANSNHIAEDENGRDLCIIFIGREEFPNESETAIVGDSTETQGNAHLSIENVQATNILVFDTNCRRTDNATNDNLPLQFVIGVLRNLGIEMSEESVQDVSIGQIQDHRDVSNVTMISDFPLYAFNTNNINHDEENNNTCDKISLNQSTRGNDMVNNEDKQILYLTNNNCSGNLDVISSVKPLENDNYDSEDEKYLSATDIYLENKVSDNNLSLINVDNNDVTSRSSSSDHNDNDDDNCQLGMLNNKTEENSFNLIFENSTEISSSKTLSLTKFYNCQKSILKSSDEELQKLTQLSDRQTTSENKGERTILNSEIRSNNDTILQSQNVETLRLTTTTQNGIRSEDEDRNIYRKTNEFLTGQFPGICSSDESDFSFLYEKNSDRSELTLNEGSLIEEFSNDIIPPITFSDTSVHNSPYTFNNGN